MHDLDYEGLFPIFSWKELSDRLYPFACCTEAAATFTANVSRVNAMCMVPGYAFMNGESWAEALAKAMQQLQTNDKSKKEVHDLASKIWDQNDIQPMNGELKRKQFFEANSNAVKMATLPGRVLSHAALHAHLQSIIIQAWSAFEIVAEDLWKKCFAEGLSSIAMPTKQEMDRQKIGFRSRLKMRNGYFYVFNRDNAELASVLNNQGIDALSLMRNVLVHSAGTIDQRFLDDSDGIAALSPIRANGPGARIEVNGKLVRELVDPVILAGFNLVQALANWLYKHP